MPPMHSKLVPASTILPALAAFLGVSAVGEYAFRNYWGTRPRTMDDDWVEATRRMNMRKVRGYGDRIQ